MSPEQEMSAARTLAFCRLIRVCFALVVPDAKRVLPAATYADFERAIARALLVTVDVETMMERALHLRPARRRRR